MVYLTDEEGEEYVLKLALPRLDMGGAMAKHESRSGDSREEASALGGRYVKVPPIPIVGPLSVQAKGLAVIVVDMQKDFIAEGGKLFVGPSATATVPRIRAVLNEARKMKVPVVYVQDWHPPNAREFEIWGPHCVEKTEGAEIIEQLMPLPGDVVIRKRTYDPFFETDLEKKLSELKVDKAVVMGTVANICVLHAVAGLTLRGIRTFVPVDCISSINEFDETLAHRQITFLYKGVLTTSDALRIRDASA